MPRLASLALLLVGLACLLLPASARADLRIAGDAPRIARHRAETHERTGIHVGAAVRSGAVILRDGFVPAVGLDYRVGGGITDRFTLGFEARLQFFMGLKLGGGADIVAERFFGRGFFLRAGVGAMSGMPARAEKIQRAGFGGQAGLGYEFRPLERLGLGLGLDYDARVRTDGLDVHTVLLGLRFRGYFKKRS
jgi:hypothetical protein